MEVQQKQAANLIVKWASLLFEGKESFNILETHSGSSCATFMCEFQANRHEQP